MDGLNHIGSSLLAITLRFAELAETVEDRKRWLLVAEKIKENMREGEADVAT